MSDFWGGLPTCDASGVESIGLFTGGIVARGSLTPGFRCDPDGVEDCVKTTPGRCAILFEGRFVIRACSDSGRNAAAPSYGAGDPPRGVSISAISILRDHGVAESAGPWQSLIRKG